IADNEELKTIALKILELPSNASKQWIYQQYDQTVQANTINQAGLNAAVIRIPQLQNKGIAISIDTNSSFCFLDPRSGSANSAAECLRNIVSTGATPIGLVDCLNFGNPEKPDSYWQFVEAVQGLGQFTHDFKIPVVGGNVSLYNETIDRDGKRLKINPTPVIGIVGEIEKLDHTLKNIIIQPNSSIYIIGNTNVDLCGTEVQKHFFNKLFGNPPDYNANAERKSMNTILQLHKENLILSCNDISQGGLFISIVEMILPSNYGVTLNLNNLPGDSTQLLEKLFSETGARYLIEIDSNRDIEVQTILQANNVVHGKIGEVSSMHTNLIIDEIIFEKLELLRRWEEGLTKYMI
ncbi:MAG: AIR synthase related protein, partial [Candidatus Heimdallarchaeota archaeon]|nr:AIR synthase related protein [Candidatus Heimdallarchaeota archaeon]